MISYREPSPIDDYEPRVGRLVRNARSGQVARVIYPAPTWVKPGHVAVNYDCVCCYESWPREDAIPVAELGDGDSRRLESGSRLGAWARAFRASGWRDVAHWHPFA